MNPLATWGLAGVLAGPGSTATAPADPPPFRAEPVPAQVEVIPTPPPRPPPSFHPLRIRWGVTAPLLATTSLGFVLMEGLGGSGPAPTVCTPPQDDLCPDLGALEPIDRVALGHYRPGAATASDVLVYAALLGAGIASLAESIAWARGERDAGVARHRRRGAARFGYDTAIWAEAIGVAMVTTNVFKAAFDRARPLTHLGPSELEEAGLPPEDLDGDFGRSFPSGHATLAFSSVVAGATLLTIKQCKPTALARRSGVPRCAPRSPGQRAALATMWGVGLAGATAVAALRVVAGKHYPTDVLMGTAIGVTSGLAVPLLHRRW